ncbi:MAG: glycosyltransferase family 4 protein [Anaerolineae bacterium]|nr:glycosyltransferase family 4 protein [Anaerolineae bacterium]
MRILFVSNYYPPCRYAWGYQQLCEEVADGLHAKGHDIAILTSTYSDNSDTAHPYPVYRVLPIDPDWNSGQSAAVQFFVGRRKRERQALASLQEVVETYHPDVIFFWDTVGLYKSLLPKAEQLLNTSVVYYFADYLPEFADQYVAYWRNRPVHWLTRFLKQPLAALALYMLAHERRSPLPRYEHCICVSNYVCQRLVSQGFIPESSVVIHNGVDLAIFSSDRRFASTSQPQQLRCLIAGRVTPEKGIHTVVEAFGMLQAQEADNITSITLTILGSGPDDYAARLREQVAAHHLEEIVKFRVPVPREHMPEVLKQYDALVLASEHAEPLARAIQEAMAMGLLVIGTITGGSGELLVHEKTGFVFESGDPKSLAAQLERALHNRDLAGQLAEQGQKAVEQYFNIHRTVEQVETYLVDLIRRKAAEA